MDRADAVQLDDRDPLRHVRQRFVLPDGMIYLDGNSLGSLPHGVRERLESMVDVEWGHDLIASWNTHGWWDLPATTSAKLAGLVGAGPDTVSMGDSTSVQLFKLLVAAARLRPERSVIVTEPGSFPTNSYIASSVAQLLGLTVRWWDAEHSPDIRTVLDDDVAVVALCHVDYRTGWMHDAAQVTAAIHDAGAITLWDVCHSAGAVDIDLSGWDTDLAVGCTYKYLNAGPGSPAFAYVHPRWHDVLDQPITGWHGHADPFALERDYRPAPGVRRVEAGAVPLLAVAAVEAAVDAFDGVAMADVRAKSLALTDLFIDRASARLEPRGVSIEVPREHRHRGSQGCLRLPDAYGFVQALIRRGVVGDFREPDRARFGFVPLYTRYVDVFDAVEHMVAVLDEGEHVRPENTARAVVT
ncbi:kynureninase [Haloactinopolyspora sp.]|uniref:kynureninase n=1 Tax=Haloactinopolyspora sp. TaxID=1966353 RepID=UPI0026361798|nr:kynureninase [Haloactinopolyspora sp.]